MGVWEAFVFARSLGLTEWLTAHAPLAVLVAFAVLTQLGDIWFLFLLAAVPYAAHRAVVSLGVQRREALFVLGLVAAYIGLIGLLKGIFDLPRPPGAGSPPAMEHLPWVLERALAQAMTATGQGFPSGHALGSTMAWGGVALVVDRGTVRTRFAGAAGIVLVVCVSRLVLGLHHLVDVVAGVLIGVLVLAGLRWATNRTGGLGPVWAFAAAVALGRWGVDPGSGSLVVLGAILGAWVTWARVSGRVDRCSSTWTGAALALAVMASGAMVLLGLHLARPAAWVAVPAGGLAGVLVVAAPVLGEGVWRRVQRGAG